MRLYICLNIILLHSAISVIAQNQQHAPQAYAPPLSSPSTNSDPAVLEQHLTLRSDADANANAPRPASWDTGAAERPTARIAVVVGLAGVMFGLGMGM
ncbi:hypothetical protein BDV95DRAFT_601145 [Massariosphaeria phaeospora]|uniref:Uncharacterized protein n=1 Tax=Massariosphaeria phaeospora TaxID=100035 RepID=A0A7C8MZ35_9PLEO|nr:hypothetical protein BDV95DRAFT_601145 [Massariosphaeria phaeospora]